MAELKTKKTEASVDDFLNGVKDEATKKDCLEIVKLMKQATKADPKMWGSSIVGFGTQHLKYASGRELDWMVIGFSPRKQNLTLYIPGSLESYAELLKKLGKHTTGKGCLYVKSLKDVNAKVLKELIQRSVKETKS
ncbi:DUF1801 domain-containing protein [Candidatus Villigracilis affinis]|uniref:DUF1801 domain-containing protein n=1 Tax=Candidatus Villigracilis affinis TaxID=3140682 RepID=UPI001DE3BD92|nr:DUF1801 domain-containing protein [Anaerolineales bacterium]